MTWLELLESAKAQPIGLAVICKCPEGADSSKRLLYLARAKARDNGNKTFDSLSIAMSPHSDEILFVYNKPETEEDSDAESPGTGSETGDSPAV